MFGYVHVKASELKVREYECYRALYCGLCRQMKTCTGNCSRLSLSYDFVFLAAVRTALTGENPEIGRIRCFLHPFRKRNAVKKSPALAYCADASAILTYGKLEDDCADERGGKRLLARLGRFFFRRAYRKAKGRRPGLDAAVRASLARLRETELSSKPASAGECAACFGDLLREVFSSELDGTPARIAGEIGNAVGKWLYLTDAADDFDDDRKKKRFNPYFTVYGDRMSTEDREEIRLALNATLGDAARAVDLISGAHPSEWESILENILYLGLPDTATRVLEQKGTRQI